MDNFDLKKYLAEGKLFEEVEDIVDFLKQNFEEFKQAIQDYTNGEDLTSEDIIVGAYLDEEGEPIESNQIASINNQGLDFSFDKKYVEDTFEDSGTFKVEIEGRTLYGLHYNS